MKNSLCVLLLFLFVDVSAFAQPVNMKDVTTYAYEVIRNQGSRRVPKDVQTRTDQVDPSRTFYATAKVI